MALGFDTLSRMLAEAVLNGLWQGVAVTAVVWAILRIPLRTSAATRYAIWSATLLIVLALPFVRMANAPLDGTIVSAPSPARALPIHLATGWAPVLLAAWSVISALMLGRLLWSYAYVCWLARTSAPLDAAWRERVARLTGARNARIFSSRETTVPVVIGLRKPAILMPQALLDRLSSAELDQIVLHEWAHVRRGDNWSNCALELMQALFFFHPAVWWIGRHLRLEREIACDDRVVTATGAPVPYAGCLAKLVEWSSCPGVSLSPGAVGDAEDVFRRVERLIHWRGATEFSAVRFAGAAAVLLLAAAFARQMPAFVDLPVPRLALAPAHADVTANSRMVLAEVRLRTANILMETAADRLASAERMMRAAKEQMRLAQLAAGNGRLPISRVSCPQPAAAAGAQLNKI